jgi:hypothetical protein
LEQTCELDIIPSDRAAITKHHNLGVLKQQKCSSSQSGGQRSEIGIIGLKLSVGRFVRVVVTKSHG